MARLTLGDQAFQEALQDYIRTYQFSNADHEMLFAKFTTAAQRHAKTDWCGRPLNVTKFLDPWFLQECFPLLTVTNNQPTSPAHVTQQPFNNISSLPISKFPYNYSWPIPLVSENYKNATPHFSWIKPGSCSN
ncbi:unnamed protein product [Anisakis simplex]|uniref:Peptidase_M1 domain-containing protein n=1 Tax=Anisakis simplex TaxID=6269 RepID=A0A0M3J8W3_ANISI|nr:unnamed protein product [Anisakis simplex]